MSEFSKPKISALIRKYLPAAFGLRVPGFIRIHFRYIRYSFLTWIVLFVAPFVMLVFGLRQLRGLAADINPNDTQIYLIAFFAIAVMFFLAERNRRFRKIYVILIPALVILYGLIDLAVDPGRFPGNLFRFAILTGIPAWWLWKRATRRGFDALTDGADKNYRAGYELYLKEDYEAAFELLEKSARRGHMKSLYLIGDAFEHGYGKVKNRVKAARLYDKAGGKGYKKAQEALQRLCADMSAAEKAQYEINTGVSGLDQLF